MPPLDNLVPREVTQALDPVSNHLISDVQQHFQMLRNMHPAMRHGDGQGRGDDEVNRGMNHELCNTNIYPDSSRYEGNHGGRRPQGRDRHESQQQYEDRVDGATSYLRDNFDKLDRGGDGQVSRKDINSALCNERDRDARQHLKTLSENYDDIKDSFQERRETHGITRADARETNSDLDRNRQIRDFSKSLHKDGLFDALDSAKNGERDGQISKGDLKEFKQDCMRMLSRGRNDGLHTMDNLKVVSEMLKQWDDPNSATYQMRDGERLMNRRTIREAAQENQFGQGHPQYERNPRQWGYRDK